MDALKRVRYRVAEITPAQAQTFVTKFFAKTKVNQGLVSTYARDMADGRWLLNGTSIVFSSDGRILDGRARLLACIQSKVSFDTLIIEGIDIDSFETIDSVRKRTLADVLTIRRERHGRALAAALRVIWAYHNDAIKLARTPSSMALLSQLETHPEIRDSIIPSLGATPLLPHGTGIALHHLFGLADLEKSNLFFSLLASESNLDGDSPVRLLKKSLEELRLKRGFRKKTYVLAIATKAWNAFSSKRPIKLLKYSPDSEPFPKIQGMPTRNLKIDRPSIESKDLFSTDTDRNITATVEMITPDMADKILSSKIFNRTISGAAVEKYARDMKEGRWKLNGQTIKISNSGQLLDGQHRLEAVKKARRPFPAIIVRGIFDKTFSSLDIGHRKTLAEVLRDRGEVNTASLASALRWLWMNNHNLILAANSSPTNGELLELLNENPDIRISIKHALSSRNLMGSGISSALHYIFSKTNQNKADAFFSRLIDGLELKADNPIYHLRERLIKNRESHRIRMAEAERFAISIKAWNSFLNDKPMYQLSWRGRGISRETLPLPL